MSANIRSCAATSPVIVFTVTEGDAAVVCAIERVIREKRRALACGDYAIVVTPGGTMAVPTRVEIGPRDLLPLTTAAEALKQPTIVPRAPRRGPPRPVRPAARFR